MQAAGPAACFGRQHSGRSDFVHPLLHPSDQRPARVHISVVIRTDLEGVDLSGSRKRPGTAGHVPLSQFRLRSLYSVLCAFRTDQEGPLRVEARSRCAPAPLRGVMSRGPVADGENSDSGVATINSRIVGVRARSRTAGSSAANSLSHGEPHRPGLQRNDKNWLDQSCKTNLLECALGISAHKKLIHTMPRKADRPPTRATVVGCAISTTSNYLKLHAPTKSNPLPAKIVPHRLIRPPVSRPPLFNF